MCRAKHTALLLCLLLCATLTTQAQGSASDRSFRTINVDDGLSQNTVYAILQDRQNLIWFATKDGLNVYNGLQCRVFGSNNSGLQCNYTTCLYEDATGCIWIGTDQGLYTYDPVLERISPCTRATADGTVPNHRIRWIADDGEGRVCVSSEGQGLFRYTIAENPAHNDAPARLDALTTTVWTFLHDGKQLWLSLYEDDLYTMDKTGKRTAFALPDGSRPFRHAMIHALLRASDGSLLIGSSTGLYRLSPDRRSMETLLADCLVRSLLLRSDKELWAGAEDGLYIVNLQTRQQEHLTTSLTNPRFSLADNSIYAICRDREGGMWLGTYFGGVNYLSPQSDLFRRYYPHDHLSHFGQHVREFCADADGTLWIGTEDRGLFHFRPSDGTVEPMNDVRLGTNIHGLCRVGDTLWVGTFANGLGRMNLRTGRLERHYRKSDDPHSLNSDYVFSICHTRSGELYIGTISGLMRYRPSTDDFERLAQPYEFIYNMLEDSDGVLWLATYFGGVYSYDPYTRRWQHYQHSDSDPHSLSYDKVISIYEDSRHRLWFLTQGHGFCLFHRDTQRFDRFNPDSVIASNTAYRMLEGNDGQLWLSTSNGLVCFTPEDGFTKVYTTGNGLTPNQFNYQSGYKSADGTLYFGCTNGFVAFNPSTFDKQNTASTLLLTDFFLSGRRVQPGEDVLPQSISVTDEVTLPADQNTFSLHAAVLSYKSPAVNRITYRLDGLDPDSVWHDADPDGRILFAHLPTGHYTLHVRGTNSDGVPVVDERLLSIRICPPFYLSTWAWLIYLTVAVLALWLGMRFWRHRQQELRRRTLEQLRRQKDQELLESKSEMIANYERLYDRFLQSPFAVERNGTLSPADQDFVDRLYQTVTLHLHESDYGQEQLCADMNMSRASLYRHLKSLIGMTPNEYLRTERLKQAAHLLRQGGLTVNEVCYRVGFNSPSYFTKCFHEQFGTLPKDF